MKKVYFQVPTINDLRYRRKWLSDAKTMAYNAGLELDIHGYDKNTGTININDEELVNWYNKWINKEPSRYYAYIYIEDNKPIGEIYYYPENGSYSMGILIDNEYRGQGYSLPALFELERIAFEKNNIPELRDLIPINRDNALKLFQEAGFIYTNKDFKEKVFSQEVLVKELLLTKDMYFMKKEDL